MNDTLLFLYELSEDLNKRLEIYEKLGIAMTFSDKNTIDKVLNLFINTQTDLANKINYINNNLSTYSDKEQYVIKSLFESYMNRFNNINTLYSISYEDYVYRILKIYK